MTVGRDLPVKFPTAVSQRQMNGCLVEPTTYRPLTSVSMESSSRLSIHRAELAHLPGKQTASSSRGSTDREGFHIDGWSSPYNRGVLDGNGSGWAQLAPSGLMRHSQWKPSMRSTQAPPNPQGLPQQSYRFTWQRSPARGMHET